MKNERFAGRRPPARGAATLEQAKGPFLSDQETAAVQDLATNLSKSEWAFGEMYHEGRYLVAATNGVSLIQASAFTPDIAKRSVLRLIDKLSG